MICCEVADRNQYKKLLGNVRIKVREFGSEVVYCTDFGQQPRNKSRWAVVSPLRPRGRRRRPRESRVGLRGNHSGSGPLRVGGGDAEGPGERGESGAQMMKICRVKY